MKIAAHLLPLHMWDTWVEYFYLMYSVKIEKVRGETAKIFGINFMVENDDDDDEELSQFIFGEEFNFHSTPSRNKIFQQTTKANQQAAFGS